MRQLVGFVEVLRVQLFERTQAAGAIRPDVTVNDLGLIFEQVAAVDFGHDRSRVEQLRQRCAQLVLDGLRATPTDPLPGPSPTDHELGERWRLQS